ncbi:carbonate dehydratase [Aurantivibrio infirmus]
MKLEDLIANNVKWSEDIKRENPDFFPSLAKQQEPEFLWIGCSDSRVPANEIVGLLPGELFVHRNVANVVLNTDLNCQTVINFAVEQLHVKHIIVCGHYGCGGVKSALEKKQLGIIDYWLRNIRDTYYNNSVAFEDIAEHSEKVDRLCELNVAQQVANVSHTNVVQNAWRRGQDLSIHGWIYSIHDGLVKQLMEPLDSLNDVPEQYKLDPRII